MTVSAILQARMSSKRLPGKVLMPILEKPMLALQLERIQRAETLDRVIVATSTAADDDPIADLCRDLGIPCYRGSLLDVLNRYYLASKELGVKQIARLTGDCPLADWTVIDRIVRHHLSGGFDYTSNTLERTWPRGLDVEVVTFDALETAWKNAFSDYDREHVMPFMWQQPDRFKLGSVTNGGDYSAKRWTVDVAQDFEFVRRVYEGLYPDNPAFDTDDILAFLSARPEIEKINAAVIQNAPPPEITSNP